MSETTFETDSLELANEVLDQYPRESDGHVIVIEDESARKEMAQRLLEGGFSLLYLPEDFDNPLPVESLLELGFQIVAPKELTQGPPTPVNPVLGLNVELSPVESGRARFVTVLGPPNTGKSTTVTGVGSKMIERDRPLLAMKWPHYTGYLGPLINDLLRSPEYRRKMGEDINDPKVIQLAASANRIAELPTLVSCAFSLGERGLILFEDNEWTGSLHGIVQAMEVESGKDLEETIQWHLKLNRHMITSDQTILLTGKRIPEAQEDGHLTEAGNWLALKEIHEFYARKYGWSVVSNVDSFLGPYRNPKEIIDDVLELIDDRDY